jgi:DNA-directed RNA polymerase II subunit RPB2
MMSTFLRGMSDLFQMALDYIGTRGNIPTQTTKESRIRYAKQILQKELLPHISISPQCETKKVRVRLILCCTLMFARHTSLATLCTVSCKQHSGGASLTIVTTMEIRYTRAFISHRISLFSQRLDLAGPLMAFLFRAFFNNLVKSVCLFS